MDDVDVIGSPRAVAGAALFEHFAVVDRRLAGAEAGAILLHVLLRAGAIVAGGAGRGRRGDDDIVEIRDGLTVGERVVIRGLETLTDQTRVRVTETG